MNNGSLSNIKSIILDIEFIKKSAIFDEELVISDSIVSDDEKSVALDLLYIIDVNDEEYINKYDAIFNKISNDP